MEKDIKPDYTVKMTFEIYWSPSGLMLHGGRMKLITDGEAGPSAESRVDDNRDERGNGGSVDRT